MRFMVEPRPWPPHGDPKVGGRPYPESARALGDLLGPGEQRYSRQGGPGCRVGMKGQGGALSTRQDREPLGSMGARAKGGGLRMRLHTYLGACPPAWQEQGVRVAGGHQALIAQQAG